MPAVFIARAISMPLKAGLEFARNMAKGDFSRELTAVASRDEAGQLAEALNEMLRALRDVVAERNNFV